MPVGWSNSKKASSLSTSLWYGLLDKEMWFLQLLMKCGTLCCSNDFILKMLSESGIQGNSFSFARTMLVMSTAKMGIGDVARGSWLIPFNFRDQTISSMSFDITLQFEWSGLHDTSTTVTPSIHLRARISMAFHVGVIFLLNSLKCRKWYPIRWHLYIVILQIALYFLILLHRHENK